MTSHIEAAHHHHHPSIICSRVQEILESSSGVYQLQKFGSDATALIAESFRRMGKSHETWQTASTVLSNGAAGIFIPSAIASTIDAGQMAAELRAKKEPITWEEKVEFFQKGMVSAQMMAYSAFLFTQKAAFQFGGDICSAFDDGSDAVLMGKKLHGITQDQRALSSVKANAVVDETRKLYCLKVARAVIAAVVGVLGLFASTLVSPLTLLVMAVASSGLSLVARWHQMSLDRMLTFSPSLNR